MIRHCESRWRFFRQAYSSRIGANGLDGVGAEAAGECAAVSQPRLVLARARPPAHNLRAQHVRSRAHHAPLHAGSAQVEKLGALPPCALSLYIRGGAARASQSSGRALRSRQIGILIYASLCSLLRPPKTCVGALSRRWPHARDLPWRFPGALAVDAVGGSPARVRPPCRARPRQPS